MWLETHLIYQKNYDIATVIYTCHIDKNAPKLEIAKRNFLVPVPIFL
jgi:hypothetical protein